MKVYKAYKFRMIPNKLQQEKLNSFLGSKRFIYNNYLTKKEQSIKDKTPLTLLDMKKDIVSFQEEYSWLKEIDSCILRTTLEDLDNSYKRYYKKQSERPKYKRKGFKESFRTNCNRSEYQGNSSASIRVDLEKRTIKLPKLDEIKIKGYRNLTKFPYKIINATISKEANRYYVSVCVEEEIPNITITPQNIIGLDLGIKDLIVCSDGIKYKKIRNIKVQERRIKGLQKALARCEKKSNNYQKIKNKIARCYQKIKNMRKYYIHEITTKLVKENDIIAIETLKVKEMIMKGKNKLAKHISNASFDEIIKQLIYKTKWHNKKLYQINTYYPSSQICCHCGIQNKKLKDLTIRVWECPNCHNVNERDLNASINIMDKGLEMYMKEQYSN